MKEVGLYQEAIDCFSDPNNYLNMRTSRKADLKVNKSQETEIENHKRWKYLNQCQKKQIGNVGEAEAMDKSDAVLTNEGKVISVESMKGLNKMIAQRYGRLSYFEQYDNVISYGLNYQDKIKIDVPGSKKYCDL